MPNIGMWELLIILVIVVLLFGTRKLPELGKGLGSGIRNFKSSLRDGEKEEIEAGQAKQQLPEGSDAASSPTQSRTTFGNNA
jgi:sec-independent protein translocase protein TatA